MDALTIQPGWVAMVTASASRLRTVRRTEANVTVTLSETVAHLYIGKR